MKLLETLVGLATSVILSVGSISYAASKTMQYYSDIVRGQAGQSATMSKPKTTLIREDGDRKIISENHSFSYGNLTPEMIERAKREGYLEVAINRDETIGFRYQFQQREDVTEHSNRLSQFQKYFHIVLADPRVYVITPKGSTLESDCYKLHIINDKGIPDSIEAVPHSLTELSQIARVAAKAIDPNHIEDENELRSLWDKAFGLGGGSTERVKQRIEQLVMEIPQREMEDLQRKYSDCDIYFVDHGEAQRIASVLRGCRTGAEFNFQLSPPNQECHIAFYGGFSRGVDNETKAFNSLVWKIESEDNATNSDVSTHGKNNSNSLSGEWGLVGSINDCEKRKDGEEVLIISPKKVVVKKAFPDDLLRLKNNLDSYQGRERENVELILSRFEGTEEYGLVGLTSPRDSHFILKFDGNREFYFVQLGVNTLLLDYQDLGGVFLRSSKIYQRIESPEIDWQKFNGKYSTVNPVRVTFGLIDRVDIESRTIKMLSTDDRWEGRLTLRSLEQNVDEVSIYKTTEEEIIKIPRVHRTEEARVIFSRNKDGNITLISGLAGIMDLKKTSGN